MAAVRLVHLLLFSLVAIPSVSAPNEAGPLLRFKDSLYHTKGLSSWKENSDPCKDDWAGITCNTENVTQIRLKGLGLSGEVDVEAIAQLHSLRGMTLAGNKFTGHIPEFNKIGTLRAIYLSDNQFSGEIPSDFFSKMRSLKKLYLDNNQFTGTIPESLAKLPYLQEVNLEKNQFSGPIPAFKQPKFSVLNFKNNILEGRIPESLKQYDPTSFAGNDGLCGEPLEKECSFRDSPVGLFIGMGLGLGVILLAVVVAIVFSRQKKEDKFRVLGKEIPEDVVQVQVSSLNQSASKSEPNQNSSVKGGGGSGSSKKGSTRGKTPVEDLTMVNDEKGSFGLPDLMKAAAEVLGNGALGSAYKAAMANGLSVVVKRMREMNELGRDSFDAEMRRLGKLRHPNILGPLAYHYRREEKLVVSEYVPRGSLLYLLHGDRGTCHAELTWPVRLQIIQGIAQGMRYLHSEFPNYDLPHGNLKSSNILLGENFVPLLNDYAFHRLTNPSHATQAMFAYKSPDYTRYQRISPKTDVYCLGIIILEILTGKFPSQYLSVGKGGTDIVELIKSAVSDNEELVELIDPEIASSTDSVGQMLQLLDIGNACTESNPDARPDMKEALRRIEEVKV